MTWSEILMRVVVPIGLGFVMGTFFGIFLGVSMENDQAQTDPEQEKK